MTEYMSIPQFFDHVMSDINERDADQVAERLNELGWQKVVRCRDCVHYREHEFVIATDVSDVCQFFAGGVKVEPDGFCAWGERRDA